MRLKLAFLLRNERKNFSSIKIFAKTKTGANPTISQLQRQRCM
jgi:hypothetical protein